VKNCTCLILVLLACGCGKKKPLDDKATGSAGAPPAAAGSAGAGSAAPVPTAEGSAVADLPVVTDCPKSLAGAETVARTIKKACGPVVVTGEYDVNGSLTLEAGAILKFQDGADLEVGYNGGAKLIVKGTDKEPVTLTSAGDAAPGAWRGVRLYRHANRSQLDHLVIENAGDDKGALYVDAQDVVVKGSTIRNAKEIGIVVDHNGQFAELAGNTFEKAGKIAIKTPPAAVGAFGVNKFDDGAYVEIEGGNVEDSAKWQNPGAPYVVIGEIDVDGKNGRAMLEITAGTELRFKDADLEVGYNREATLVVSGTADKPVIFTAAEDKTPGTWHGIWVYAKGEVRIANAAISYGGGGHEDRGALYLDRGTATITGTTFKDNKRGVNIKDGTTIKSFDQNKLSASPEPALATVADAVGGLGSGNTFDKDAHIEITGGKIAHAQTWLPQGVAYEIINEVTVDDKQTLTLAPGVELAFAGDQQLSIGYNSDGTLKAVGTKDQPIKLHATRDDVTWKGLFLYGHAVGSELANLQLAGTSGDAGIIVEQGASAKLTDIACARCKGGTLTSKCGATITTAGIKAGEGTPTGEIKPTCNK
jgi:hypothetical protein